MKLRIIVQELSRALSLMQGIATRKSTMPILNNVHAEVTGGSDDGRLTLSVTDLDVGMRTEIPCDALEEGGITIPAKALADMVRVLPGPDVTLRSDAKNHIEVKSGRTKAKLLGIAADEFPRLPDYTDVNFVSLDATLFNDMVERTVYATSTDETRYNLNGVLFEPAPKGARDESNIVMVATDGHRLVRFERQFSAIAEHDFSIKGGSVIIPRKGLSELRKMLDGSDGDMELGFQENHMVVRSGSTVLGMRLIDGAFPDYKQVIPKDNNKHISVDRSTITDSLKRVSVLAADRAQPVKITVKKGKLHIECANPDAGDVTEEVDAETTGGDIEVAFSAKYLMDAINSIDDNRVVIKLNTANHPGLVVGANEPYHQCVVMPMRL